MVTKAEKLRRKRLNRPAAKPATPAVVDGPVRKRAEAVTDGWEWLKRKGRVNRTQREAGDRWRALYRDVGEAPPMPSCLGLAEGRGERNQHMPALAEHRADAAQTLAILRSDTLRSHEGMIGLLDAVCGRGVTLTEMSKDSREAGKREAQLRIALDLVASDGRRMAA